jgi:thiol:disulfide interchange protein DsbD
LTQSIAQLEVELSKAKEAKKFVLLDFYADWCISCKEMEINTFANPEVSQELKQFILLQVDVTKNSAENQALLKRFGLYGPPGILIFNLDSQEQQSLRVVGYMPPQRFIERLKQVNK